MAMMHIWEDWMWFFVWSMSSFSDRCVPFGRDHGCQRLEEGGCHRSYDPVAGMTRRVKIPAAFQNLVHLTSTLSASSVLAHLPFSISPVSVCSVGSVCTLCATHCNSVAVMSFISLWTLMTCSPLQQLKVCLTPFAFLHAHMLAIPVGRHPHLSSGKEMIISALPETSLFFC